MSKALFNKQEYVRLLDGSGNALSSSGGALNVGATFSGDVTSATASNFLANVNLHDGSGSAVDLGQALMAASLPVALASNQSALDVNDSTAQGHLATIAGDTTSLDSKVTACNTGAVVVSSSALPTGAATAAKQAALGTAGTASSDVLTVQGIASMTALVVDGSGSIQPVSSSQLPTMLGSVASTGSLPVVLANDHADVTVDNGGTFAVQADAVPVAGAHANAYNAVTTSGANEKSSAVDLQYCSKVAVFGSMDGAATITVEASQNNSNWYTTSYSYPGLGAENFYIEISSFGARYARLSCSASGVTVTGSIVAKC